MGGKPGLPSISCPWPTHHATRYSSSSWKINTQKLIRSKIIGWSWTAVQKNLRKLKVFLFYQFLAISSAHPKVLFRWLRPILCWISNHNYGKCVLLWRGVSKIGRKKDINIVTNMVHNMWSKNGIIVGWRGVTAIDRLNTKGLYIGFKLKSNWLGKADLKETDVIKPGAENYSVCQLAKTHVYPCNGACTALHLSLKAVHYGPGHKKKAEYCLHSTPRRRGEILVL